LHAAGLNRSEFARFVRQTGRMPDVPSGAAAYIAERRIDYVFIQDGHPFLGQVSGLPLASRTRVVNVHHDAWWLLAFDWRGTAGAVGGGDHASRGRQQGETGDE
jgi:hypothetical protein